MIELIGVLLAAGIIGDLTRRRGGEPWLAMPVALTGYGLISFVLPPGPTFAVGGLWLVLCYVGVFFLLGRGKRARSTWQCPECQFFNHPSTLVCPCGQRFEEEAPSEAAAGAD
ncbi:MAG: hypothetical protein SX243_24520 [Acidobacteriota bacterium]|nr:hypothetical protein [Acidobacteriota bacterium]